MSLYPKPKPRKREVLIYREGDSRFSKALGLEYCVLPETTRTEESVQLHIEFEDGSEQWMPLDYGHKLHRATGRNMEIVDGIIGLRTQILSLEEEIRKKLVDLQDEITPENIGDFFHKEDTELER
uniref:Uncharacterized protein n=1 Tax=viral metagenome TaxID=1070528 RepID=A0A6M3MGC8_9ZZZZ